MPEEALGRDAELEAAARWLAELEPRPAALVFEGDPGIGKTTVWRESVRLAERQGCRVLQARPAEAESKLSFSALADLLEAVPDLVFTSLPELQRRALEVALLRVAAETASHDPRAVAAGLRSAVAALAESSPVVIAIDDVQWLDAPSRSAIEFALRRLPAARVGLLASRRTDPRHGAPSFPSTLPGVQVIELGPLSLAVLHELLKRRLGRPLPRPLLVRVHATSGGNPFYALEIAHELLRERARPGDPLPVPKDLRRLLARRLARLSPAAREVLLILATLGPRARPVLAAVVGADPSEALVEAERVGLVEVEKGRVGFSHPLYAASVYASISGEQRRRLHQRLATVVDDVEQRARHLALASTAPDSQVAAALDEAAAFAARRGAAGMAAELTELALEQTPAADEDRRQDRAVELIDHLLLTADVQRAWQVARRELPALRGAERRVRVLLVLSELAQWTGDWDRPDQHPVALAEEALEAAAGDPSLEARCHSALASRGEGDSEQALVHARRALELVAAGAELPPAIHADVLCSSARSDLFRGRGLDVACVERAIELERAAPERQVHHRSSTKLGQWLKYVDEFGRSRQLLEQARRSAHDEGDDFSLVNILTHLIVLECWAGRWQVAYALGAEYAQRDTEFGPHQRPGPHVALVAALTGDAETVRALEYVPPLGGLYDVIRLRPLGLLALSQDDAKTAHAHHRRALELRSRGGVREPAVFRIHADAVESAIAAGALDEAVRVTRELRAHARRSRIPWNRMAAARSGALVAAARGELEPAGREIEKALADCRRVPMPFERGRTLLVKGEIERRAKRKSAAKASLEEALGIFEELGAPLWAERAGVELQRVGLRPRAPDELTESERRVAELAASGLTNREVAAKVFMSPKTVEANLARAYRKLGIHSRAELGARVASVGREPAQT